VELQLLLELPELEHEELLEVLVPVFAFLQEKITTSAGVLPVPVPPVPGSVGKLRAITSLLNKVNKAILDKEKYIFVFIFDLLKIVKYKKQTYVEIWIICSLAINFIRIIT